jgi:hypothetical protein
VLKGLPLASGSPATALARLYSRDPDRDELSQREASTAIA